MTRTKSNLGTIKPIKSVTRRKPKKGDKSATTTSLPYYGIDYGSSKDLNLMPFLILLAIVIYLIWRVFNG